MVRGLSWPEIDSYLMGHERQQQREQLLPRLAAWAAFNTFQLGLKEPQLIGSDRELWPLPLVDKPTAQKPPSEAEELAALRARLEQQNRERLAARAAQPVP